MYTYEYIYIYIYPSQHVRGGPTWVPPGHLDESYLGSPHGS